MGDPDSARALRPQRRPTLPGGPTLFRAGLVAALLGLAAAVLHTPTGCPPPAAPVPGPTGASATSRQTADGTPINHGRPDDDGEAGPTDDGETTGPPPTGPPPTGPPPTGPPPTGTTAIVVRN
ncbi:hypothetical protein ABZU25_00150 [Micromonospora sp. NPDC005215]|uniref:hypothetical protein n=1 Tax=Micromonospora sp. NPDC005215 TaxID=3157024 RepID=UPI0033A33AAD